MQKFGEILRSEITGHGLTLESVAKAAKTHKGYISGICTGTLNPPSPKLVRRLCEILDLDCGRMLALAAFEKLPKGVPHHELKAILIEAQLEAKAPGRRAFARV